MCWSRGRGRGSGHLWGLEASRRVWFVGIEEGRCCEAEELRQKCEEEGRKEEARVWLSMKRRMKTGFDVAQCQVPSSLRGLEWRRSRC